MGKLREKKRWSLTSFRPVITRSALAENKVVRAEKATKRTRANGIHGSGLEINQDRAGNILVRANLVVVDGDPLELKVVVALVETIALNAVLVRDDFPKFDTCEG